MTSLWTHCPNSGYLSGWKSARTPRFRVSHVFPPSVVSNAPTAEMPTHSRSLSDGWGTIEWRHRPPAPGCHSGRVGWLRRPSTCCHVAPSSSLRNRPAGSTPAEIDPWAAVTFQTVGTFGPSSPYVSPSLECVQLSPRSSLRQTAGPYHGLPPPARIAPVSRSIVTSWIGQPSQSGPRTDHVSRPLPRSMTNAPLRVPTSSTGRSAMSLLLPVTRAPSRSAGPSLPRRTRLVREAVV